MRTNIDINDELLAQTMTYSSLKTKKDIINEALKVYLRKLLYDKLQETRGPSSWEGDLEEWRTIKPEDDFI